MTTAEKKPVRLTPKQWAEAETLWELGDVALADLAKKFGITEQAVSQHMKKKGVQRGKRAAEHAKKVSDEVARQALEDAAVAAARIRETKEEHYKMAAGVAKLTWSEVLTAKQNNVPLATITNNLKALEVANNILARSRAERYAVLGLDKDHEPEDDKLPVLEIAELTQDEIEELRDRDFNEFEELPADGALDHSVTDDCDSEADDVVDEG